MDAGENGTLESEREALGDVSYSSRATTIKSPVEAKRAIGDNVAGKGALSIGSVECQWTTAFLGSS